MEFICLGAISNWGVWLPDLRTFGAQVSHLGLWSFGLAFKFRLRGGQGLMAHCEAVSGVNRDKEVSMSSSILAFRPYIVIPSSATTPKSDNSSP